MLNLNLLTIVEEEESKIKLIYEKIRDFFFASDTYEHFSTASRMSSLRIFITALLVGVFAFVVVFSVKKRAAKRFVDAVNKFENLLFFGCCGCGGFFIVFFGRHFTTDCCECQFSLMQAQFNTRW